MMAKKKQPDTRAAQDHPDDERTRTRAYELWEQAGRPDGGAEDYWRQAEADLRNPMRAEKTATTPEEADAEARKRRRANVSRDAAGDTDRRT
jgi:hypothetical protein